MALNVGIPMQGQGIDTASPLMDLVAMNRQNRLDSASLATSNVETASKANLYTMQVMSAGAAGGQAAYDAAKEHVAKVVGPDAVAGWAPDAATGATQAKALQTALITPVAMMNAGINQQKADAETAAGLGVKPPVPPNSGLAATQGAQSAPVAQPVQPVAMTQGGAFPGANASAPAPFPAPGGGAMPAQQVQTASADPQQGIQQIQQHYQSASPEDKAQAQAVVNGAVQLQSLQNNPEAVTKFLDDPNNMHDQQNIDMRKLWKSDTTPGKQQFWQRNATHIQLGKVIGIVPDDSAQPNAQPQPATQAQTISADSPNPPQPNESPKARTERQAGNLAIQKAQLENDPAHAGTMEGAKTEYKNAADYKNGLINQISENEGAMRIINAQEDMLKSFKPGALTTDRAAMANFATTLGLPDSIVKGIAGGDPGAIEAFQGLASQHALLQLKSLMTNGKIGQREFLSFKEDLANPNKLESSIRAINQIQKDNYSAQIKELGAMTDWENSGKPLSTFRQNYAQTVSKDIMAKSSGGETLTLSGPDDPAFKSLPPGAKFIDKDTGQQMVKH